MKARPPKHLWRWASNGLHSKPVKLGSFHPQPHDHWENAAFVDAVHTASHVLLRVLPVVRGFANLRHSIRGTSMPPEVESLSFLQNWNSAEEFLEGAQLAHEAVLRTLWRPSSSAISSEVRESLGPDVVRWLDDVRNRDVGKCREGNFSNAAIDIYARFESFGGPRSLEHIRNMDASSLRNLRDPDRLAAFHDDTFNGSSLNLVVATVTEARANTADIDGNAHNALVKTVRRADRVHLDCDFNLREGIASAFRVSKIEELLIEHVAEDCEAKEATHDDGAKDNSVE